MAKIDKSKWDTNIKVSQKTIDEIKKMGMTKALKTVAGATKASKMDSSAAAWAEGVKRLYGSNRVSTAVKSAAPKGARGSASVKVTPKKPAGYGYAGGAKSMNTGKKK